VGIAPEVAHALWAHARELAGRAVTEFEPAHVRRALVTLAVAGAAGEPDEYLEVVAVVHASVVKLALDPVPLFDAASALCEPADVAAREALVTYPRRPPRERAPGTWPDLGA
jgi:hypothetical protein